jgi:hypothetical protein
MNTNSTQPTAKSQILTFKPENPIEKLREYIRKQMQEYGFNIQLFGFMFTRKIDRELDKIKLNGLINGNIEDNNTNPPIIGVGTLKDKPDWCVPVGLKTTDITFADKQVEIPILCKYKVDDLKYNLQT